MFQDNGDGAVRFGRIDCYKRGAFILEAKQGSEVGRAAAKRGEDHLGLFGQTALRGDFIVENRPSSAVRTCLGGWDGWMFAWPSSSNAFA